MQKTSRHLLAPGGFYLVRDFAADRRKPGFCRAQVPSEPTEHLRQDRSQLLGIFLGKGVGLIAVDV